MGVEIITAFATRSGRRYSMFADTLLSRREGLRKYRDQA
jgi:hypothetical protein